MIKIKFTQLNKNEQKLVELAREALTNSYSPYSNYKVGASVLSENNNFFIGCNVESSSFTLTTHAEINAIDSMIAAGDKKIKSLCVCVDEKNIWPPCGLCRQKINEFALNSKISIIACNLKKIHKYSLKELTKDFFHL